jgi:mannose-6-phosphate isomerase
MYPIKFENIYFEKIWGGRDFEKFRKNLPDGNIGESWDVACHKSGTSIIANGEFKGMKISELIDLQGYKLLGSKMSLNKFPLLVKLINAKDKLSVQVHPGDSYAEKLEGEMGKTEIWYVVEAEEGAELILGTKECSKEQFINSIKSGQFGKYLNNVSAKKGDVFFIESGLIHAIGAGVIIAEIQQNSDTTYRVYDYNRGRELHIDKAIEVVNLKLKGDTSHLETIIQDGYNKIVYCRCKHFTLELYNIETKLIEKSDEERFYIFTCVDGTGEIIWKNGSSNIVKGESILIPALLGAYEIRGKMKVLKSYVPNL